MEEERTVKYEDGSVIITKEDVILLGGFYHLAIFELSSENEEE